MLDLRNRGENVPIDGLFDPRPLLEKLDSVGAFLQSKELLALASFLNIVKRLKGFVVHHCKSAPLLSEVFGAFTSLPDITKLIRSKIDDEGCVKDDASPALKKLKRRADEAEAHIHGELRRLIRILGSQNILQESYHTLRGERFVLPVRAGAKGRVRGIVHDVSHSGETFFIEPIEVVELSNNLATIRLEIREEVRRILIEISDAARAELPTLRTDTALAAQFDFLYAKARFAFANNFAIADIMPGGTLKLLQAHHPLLYLKDKDASVPLTIRFNEEDRVLVISGPNAGGKTTALKTIGLVSMMVQSGLAIPAFPDSRLPVFTEWFADIGDEQDVTEGVSTFSAHIRNIAHILREADEKSLVLLDELGTATDPTEGGPLAVSILERLAGRTALTIVTSHLSPLKAWAHEFPGARNASFRLDEVTHKPSFQIMLDVPGASEALLIAECEGLPPEILRRASELLPKGEVDLSALIQSLQKKEKEIEENKREIATLLKEHKKLRYRVRELQEYLKQKERTLTEDMLSAKEALLTEARQFIEKQIAHLPSREAVVQARKEITREIQSVQKQKRRIREEFIHPVDLDKFYVGQTVYITDINEYAEIKKIKREKSTALLVLKGMEVTTPLLRLKIPAAGETPVQIPPRVSYQRKSDVSLELDLHGMRVEEMLTAVERYLNDAALADLPYVRLVHGIGTGALRRALQDCLKTHPLVKNYRYGTPEEGGGGVTIVNL